MTAVDTELAEEAKAILDSAQPVLPGMEIESKVTILGTTVTTNDQFVLGERVEFRVVGYVTSAGDELVENEGKRRVVKVKSTLIQVVDSGAEESASEA